MSATEFVRTGSNKTLPASLLLWLLAFALLIVGLWWLTSTRIASERVAAEEAIFSEAISLSKAYAEQLDNTILQIEQLTLSLQYQWVKFFVIHQVLTEPVSLNLLSFHSLQDLAFCDDRV